MLILEKAIIDGAIILKNRLTIKGCFLGVIMGDYG